MGAGSLRRAERAFNHSAMSLVPCFSFFREGPHLFVQAGLELEILLPNLTVSQVNRPACINRLDSSLTFNFDLVFYVEVSWSVFHCCKMATLIKERI